MLSLKELRDRDYGFFRNETEVEVWVPNGRITRHKKCFALTMSEAIDYANEDFVIQRLKGTL